MSLRKKIIFSFFISAFVIAILAAFEYVNFVQVRNGMRFLEVTDTVRSKSLELRRHEKNFFLFPNQAAIEAAATHDYLQQLQDTAAGIQTSDAANVNNLRDLLSQYGAQFDTISNEFASISADLVALQPSLAADGNTLPLMLTDIRNKPIDVANYLRGLGLPANNPQVLKLQQADTDINNLRDTGENILSASDTLDKDARNEADNGIRQSQIAILVFFPLFLLFGVGALLYISTGVVQRLRTLTKAIDQIGQRYAHGDPEPDAQDGRHKDEVDVLVDRFNRMNEQLISWEGELEDKNRELLQSKKLAAIGTLAAGVAHEINNPLNNISLSAQVLERQLKSSAAAADGGQTADAGAASDAQGAQPAGGAHAANGAHAAGGAQPAGGAHAAGGAQAAANAAALQEIVDDVISQTARMKAIVGNLLEFAREREPQLTGVDMLELIERSWALASAAVDTREVDFVLDSEPDRLVMRADPLQMERVFVNLFSNAVSAMKGRGQLGVQIRPEADGLHIFVSDTGKGIPEEDREKIFDPFFTRKEKGTGLGLAIVMNIISKHGGHVRVLSEEKMGTVFDIVFPSAPPQATGQAPEEDI